MSDKLSFKIDPRIPHDPNSGYLYTLWPRPNEAFVANSATKVLSTGVTVNVPSGCTVRIRGMYENEAQNIRVAPMDIHGPVSDYPVQIAICNQANVTAHIQADRPMATVQAIATPKARIWQDASEQEQDDAA